MAKQRNSEPDIQTALGWWSELTDKWTPIGWKNHLFRFNIFFNGTILAQPHLNRRTTAYEGLGVQLSFPSLAWPYDCGSVLQGWDECDTPVLWTEWASDGCLIRQQVFGYVPGISDTITGIEPLYAWIRLSVYDICPYLPTDEKISIPITLNAPHISVGMRARNNIYYNPDHAQYPRALFPECASNDLQSAWRLMEEGDKVRLGFRPSSGCNISFELGKPTEKDSTIRVDIPRKKGISVEILLPMLPTPRDEFDKVLSKGFDQALLEANTYWSARPATAAVFDCPEDHINNAIKHNLRMAPIIAERDPATGICSILSGSLAYSRLWATPGSMALMMFLDALGYHEAVEHYLTVFKHEQGTVVPPGESFTQHPGYLSTPKSLTSINWLTDHGALLWAISQHALLWGDTKAVNEWIPTILKACEFIRDARAIKGHAGVAGLMPPAVASDLGTQIQATWTDGWVYKGLTTAVRLLKRISHPRAAEFEQEARDYRNAFRKAIKAKAESTPRWIDRNGREHPFAPIAMYGEKASEIRHAFYLDAGPLFLVFSGLMSARDELMKSALKWFREGPQIEWYRYDSDCWQVPCLVHEMSSCEPCYSWNVFHSHQLGDRNRFLEGMYSLFAGAYSRQTFTVCETRGGITGTCHWLPSVWLARLAVIDDQIAEDELHLLRLIPLAWLKTNRPAQFERIPTEFGPVTLRVGLANGGTQLEVHYSADLRICPKRIIVHVPPVRTLKSVWINGKPAEWDPQTRSIEIER